MSTRISKLRLNFLELVPFQRHFVGVFCCYFFLVDGFWFFELRSQLLNVVSESVAVEGFFMEFMLNMLGYGRATSR